jgi:endonuclease/exonuclease/phosphatase (EEP) superfamily protein YafD
MNEPEKLSLRQWLLRLMSLTIQHIAITVSCGLCFMLVCIGFARVSPWLELMVHFSFHALVATLVVIPILWFTKHHRTAVVCSFVGACLIVLVQPWYFIPIPRSSKPEALRVLSWNVYAANDEFDAVVEVIRQSNPDVLVIVEVRPDLLERAPWIKEQYPEFEVIPNWGGAGIGVFCRGDDPQYSVEFEVRHFGSRLMPSIVATLASPDGTRHVDLIATHTYSPTPPYRATLRDKQLGKFLEWSQKQTNPQCLVGDLNTTPWTRSFWELERAGFRDSRHGAGNCASWPAWLGPAGIPIDHALTRGDCTITERKVLSANAGSDHRPIEFKLSF